MCPVLHMHFLIEIFKQPCKGPIIIFHFSDEETEAQKKYVQGLYSLCWKVRK